MIDFIEMGIIIFNITIYYWWLLLISIFIILFQNSKWIREKTIKILLLLKKTSVKTYVWVKKRSLTKWIKEKITLLSKKLLNRIKKRFKDEKFTQDVFLSVIIFFGGIFSTLLIFTSVDIYKFFKGEINPVILVSIFLIVITAYTVWSLVMQLGHKITGYWSFLVLIMSLMVFNQIKIYHYLLILSIIICFITFILSFDDKEKYSLWLIGTIVIMVIIFSTGLLGLFYTSYSEHNISLKLNINGNTSNQYSGNLNCFNKNNNTTRIKTGDIIICNISNDAEVINYSIKLDNNKFNYTGNSNVEISLPEIETRGFYFETNLKDNDKTIFVSTLHDYKILNKESWLQKDREFFTLIYYLLGIVFFSIPLMMVNLRNLAKIKTKKEF